MATRTRKQLKKERFLKIYFHYWKLQNNPEYIEYWKKQIAFHKDYKKDSIEALNSLDNTSIIENAKLKRKLGLAHFLIDPFKKIDWEALVDSNKIDSDIINALVFSPFHQPVKVQTYHVERGLVKAKFALDALNTKDARDAKFKLGILKKIACEKEKDVLGVGDPILRVLIDLTHDKKNILEKVSRCIDEGRKERKLDLSKSRDQINKFHIYAEVWDLRKGFPKRSFRDIARELKRPVKTVHSQFKRAYEYLYNKPYESTEHRSVQRSLVRKTTCKDCPERSECKIPCSDVLIQLKGIEISQAHKLDRAYIDQSGIERSTYERALERESVRKWREQSN